MKSKVVIIIVVDPSELFSQFTPKKAGQKFIFVMLDL